MIKLTMPVIVEGKYDKITLSQFLDAVIIPVNGFGVFKDKPLLEMLRVMAKKTGIIILTDSDAAGFKIRSYLRSAVRDGTIVNVYIPDIMGKERRKAAPSKEGKLGVEGIDSKTLLAAFEKAGVIGTEEPASGGEPLTKADLFVLGFSGREDSARRRERLLKALGFPERMSANALLPALNTLYRKEEFYRFAEELLEKEGEN